MRTSFTIITVFKIFSCLTSILLSAKNWFNSQNQKKTSVPLPTKHNTLMLWRSCKSERNNVTQGVLRFDVLSFRFDLDKVSQWKHRLDIVRKLYVVTQNAEITLILIFITNIFDNFCWIFRQNLAIRLLYHPLRLHPTFFLSACDRGIYFAKYYGGGGDKNGCWEKIKTEGVGEKIKKKGEGEKEKTA